METKPICPACGKPLPPDVPLGLCPECLLRSGFPTGAEPAAASEPRFVPPPVSELSARFPQYEIHSLIGQGGMGAVYKARQPALDRFVAIKILPPGSAGDPGYAERFSREARALARLNHPNIVAVYDFGQAGGQPFLVMELVDGLNLRQVGALGHLAPEQALRIVPQICEALEFAHSEGVVHRDIKPENILLDKRGRVKITDFGIAKMLGVTEGNVSLTGAKDVIGTPHYMAPEQIEQPRAVDHRADIYSLGVVFYELLTGELPLGKFQPPSRKVQVDVRLDEVVLHALEKEPERRYQRAAQVKTDIENITRESGPLPQTPLPSQAGAGPESRQGQTERRRNYLLWYGIITCAVGLPVTIGLGMPLLAGVSIGGLIIGAYKMGWLSKAGSGGPGNPPPPAPVATGDHLASHWPVIAALTCVLFFLLVLLSLLGMGVFRAGPDLSAIAYVLTVLVVPALVFLSAQLARRWLRLAPGQTVRSGAGALKAMGATGLLLSLVYCGFGVFFLAAFISERGRWHPAPDEALIVPLCWAGALLLPVSTWLLFNAAGSRSRVLHAVFRGRVIVVGVLAVLVQASALYLGRKEAANTIVITGTVSDATNARPIAGARVDDNTYDAGPGRAPQHTWTDKNGNFSLVSIGEEHTVAVSAPGYETKLETLRVNPLGQYENEPMFIRLHREPANASETNAVPEAEPGRTEQHR